MANQFKRGDKVKIKKSSRYWAEDSSSNPRDMEGEVLHCQGTSDHPVRVQWESGSTNVYNLCDLKIIKKPVDELLLAEVYYKDSCEDVLEIDTESSEQVYFRTGEGDSSDSFTNAGKTVMLNRKQVRKVRKQLKAWLDNSKSKA